MFTPENHCIWKHVPELRSKSNIRWALPLKSANEDFKLVAEQFDVIGHLSIDRAFMAKPTDSKVAEESTRKTAFISSSTQHIDVDAAFIEAVLKELPNHPNVGVHIDLHPGIQDLDVYVTRIIKIHQAQGSNEQFKILLSDKVIARFKTPELTINNSLFSKIFLRTTLTGPDGAAAADMVGQSVPGALPNKSALEGHRPYCHFGKPYLPKKYFAENLAAFFNAQRDAAASRMELELDERSTGERCAEVLLGM